jgi:diguanylate cyclase (GGDEF)-like protein
MNTAIRDSAECLPWASDDGELRARTARIAGQLRAAAVQGDELRITRLLSELLRLDGPSPEQKIRLQLQTLTQLVDSLNSIALTDDLTGLYNRRGFLRLGAGLLDTARRELRPACLVYLDLDNLKRVNDTAGHAAGDVLIRQTANLLRSLFPTSGIYDVLGRLGGDEFAGLKLGDNCPSMKQVLASARKSRVGSSRTPSLSLSAGVAYFDPQHPVTITELFARAEEAMYEHKRVHRIASSELSPRA